MVDGGERYIYSMVRYLWRGGLIVRNAIVFWCIVAAAVSFGISGSVAESPGEAAGEKLLFGFEQREVQKAVEKRASEYKAGENGDFLFFLLRETNQHS